MTITINRNIVPEAPDTITAVSLIGLSRSDTLAPPAGVTLPLAFSNLPDTANWRVGFDDDAPPPYYMLKIRLSFPDSSIVDFDTIERVLPVDGTNPAQVYCYLKSGNGAPLAGKQFHMQLRAANTGVDGWSNAPFESSPSDSIGYAVATAQLGAEYRASLDGACWSQVFTVDAVSFHLNEILGNL